MAEENDLKRLQLQVEKSKIMVHQSAVKVEELEASMREIYNFKDRLVIFSKFARRKLQTQSSQPAPNGQGLGRLLKNQGN